MNLFAWIEPDWIIALLTAVLAYATWRLVVETRRMAQDAVLASRQSAKLTQDANRIAMAGISVANRPWLAVDDVAFGVESGAITLDASLKNYGKTPAVKVDGKFLAMIVGPEEESLWCENEGSPPFMPPGAQRIVPIKLPEDLSEDVWNEILTGKRKFYAGIYLSYSFPGSASDQGFRGVFEYNPPKNAFHTVSHRQRDVIPESLRQFLE